MNLIEQLELHEGRRRFPYTDTVGKLSIGVGRNLTDKGLRDDEIDYLLMNDIQECRTDLQTFPWFRTLDPVRQQALGDFRFNLGAAGFRKFTQMIAALEAKDYARAARSMKASRWARQVQPSRSARLIQMMETGAD